MLKIKLGFLFSDDIKIARKPIEMRLLFKWVQQVVCQVTIYFCKLWCAV